MLILLSALFLSVNAGNFIADVNDIALQITPNDSLISFCDVFPKENITCIKKIILCIEERCESTEGDVFSMKKDINNLKMFNISSVIDFHNDKSIEFSDIVDPEKYISKKSTQFTLTDGIIVLKMNLLISCQDNYLVPKCEVIDLCKKLLSGVCQNNGKCLQTEWQISCLCEPNFTGTYCQSRNDPCEGNLCHNNSKCLLNRQSPLGYTCDCHSGYTGTFCNNDINECMNQSICSHLSNATCYNTYGSHMCLCDKSCHITTTNIPLIQTTIQISENEKSGFIWPLNGMNTLLLVVLEGTVIIMLILVLIFVQIKHYPMKKKKTNYFLDDDFQFTKRNKPNKDRITLESNYVRQPIMPMDNSISLAPIFDSPEHDQSFNNDLGNNTPGMSTFGRR